MARTKKVHFEAFKRYGIWQIKYGRSDFRGGRQVMSTTRKGKVSIIVNFDIEQAGARWHKFRI